MNMETTQAIPKKEILVILTRVYDDGSVETVPFDSPSIHAPTLINHFLDISKTLNIGFATKVFIQPVSENA